MQTGQALSLESSCNRFALYQQGGSVWLGKKVSSHKCHNVDCMAIYTVFGKNTHSHFLSYLHELFVDLNKNCSEYTQGLTDSENVKS